MFTGIVEEMGTVAAVESTGDRRRLRVRAARVLDDAEVGASIAHNGVCLTVTDVDVAEYWVEAVGETLSRSTLGTLTEGDRVNLERPLRLADRLGGHLVQGHVDGVGVVASHAEGRLRVEASPAVLRYVVEKGSIAIDGVALTVTDVDDSSFAVALIPHTAEVTTLGGLGAGDRVNLEVDLIAKYVERLVLYTKEPGSP